MRPRHKLRKTVAGHRLDAVALQASMRPRHKAAENRKSAKTKAAKGGGFNEAAA